MNGSTQTASTPSSASSSARRRAVHRNGGWVPGPDHLVRVRVEGDDHDRQPALGGDRDGPADDALVAAVHAVEDADGDHASGPSPRHVVQALPALHVRILLPSGGSAG